MEKYFSIKISLLDKLIDKLTLDKLGTIEALDTTKSLASSKEFVAESKWDTRGIEAGYLAGAQEKRLKELDIELASLEQMRRSLEKSFKVSTCVEVGALVWTKEKQYYITPFTGGLDIETKMGAFKIITLKSPMFKKLKDEEIKIIDIN